MRVTELRSNLPCCSLALSLLALPLCAAPPPPRINTVAIDASAPAQAPLPTTYRGGTSTSPAGHSIGVNSMYLTLDGKPWLPVMGEFHFSRVPEAEWEQQILKMKAAGVQIVATYIFWIHHEEVEGHFDWSGQRSLHRFVALCAQHGMLVVVRIGPWAHGEARNGGLPDWLLKQSPTRANDPAYLHSVAAFDAQIAAQLKGLLWKDGGPVIGIQLENEYAARGPLQGEAHILKLKALAVQNGLDVPLYTVTGWDNAVVPRGQVLPVFGGYPDAPWDASLTDLSPGEVYMFRFGSRVAGNMGMMGARAASGESAIEAPDTPFITAEMGGGIQDTYHRRPVVQPDDIAAMMPVMLGSGVNLYGTYMFQGGENPTGLLTTLQESQSTGYPTDVPTKSYDFQAPLGEFGAERESLRKLKVFDYFLHDFGSALAPMSAHPPDTLSRAPGDLTPLRASVRSQGRSGFLFVNNYVRGALTNDSAMPARKAAQFEIRLPLATLRIPRSPIDIPSGAYFIWPFNFDLGLTTLRYSTAQLFTHIKDSASETYIFEEIPGIPTEFVLEDVIGLTIHGVSVHRQNGEITIADVPAGIAHSITLRRGSGPQLRLILLTQAEAENAWKADIAGAPHLVLTRQDFFTDGHNFVLQSNGDPRCSFTIYPDLTATLKSQEGALTTSRQAGVLTYSGVVPEARAELRISKVQTEGQVPPVQLGPSLPWRPQGVAMAPSEDAFHIAAKWKISINGPLFQGAVSNAFLTVHYTGDVARLSSGNKLLVDNFYNGQSWSIGLRRFAEDLQHGPLELTILPIRKDAPVFLERGAKPTFAGSDQVLQMHSATLLPQYQFTISQAAGK